MKNKLWLGILALGYLLVLTACGSGSGFTPFNNQGNIDENPGGGTDPSSQEPAAPTGVAVTDIHQFGGLLHWNLVAAADSYKILYLASPAASAAELGEALTPQTSFELRNFGANGTFEVGVSACNANGCSDGTFVTFQTLPLDPNPGIPLPSTPTNVHVTDIHHFGATLRWDPAVAADTYKIFYGSGADVSELAEVPASQTSYELRNFGADGSYLVYVQGCNAAGCGTGTGVGFHTPPIVSNPSLPAAITNVHVTNIHQFGATLHWDPAAGATTYKILYASGPVLPEIGEVPGSQTTFELRNFGANGSYLVYVVGCNAAGCGQGSGVGFHTLPL